MERRSKTVNVGSISDVTRVIENLLTSGFGPQGKHTLMSTSTGQVTVTNHGAVILNSLHFAHPIARVVLDAVNKTVSFTGDGCKTYVTYLNSFMEVLKDAHSENCMEVCKNLELFRMHVYPTLVEKVVEKSEVTNLAVNREESEMIIKSVFRQVLHSQHSAKLVDIFSSFLFSAVFDESANSTVNFWERLQFLIDNFDSFVIKLPTMPYRECEVLDPIIIQRDFTTSLQNFDGEQEINFVMCTCGIEDALSQDGFSEVINLTSNQDFCKFMAFQRKKVEKFVKNCKENSVSLVLSQERIPDFALEIFNSNGISAIHYVLSEDITLLENVLQKQAIVDVHDDIVEHNICAARKCIVLVLSGKKHVQIVLHKTAQMCPKTLIVAAPTQGLCDQLVLTLKSCLKVLSLCDVRNFSDPHILNAYFSKTDTWKNFDWSSSPLCMTINGGGSFEIFCSKFLKEYSKTIDEPSLKNFCLQLSTSLLSVPRILHRNNSVIQENLSKDFIEKMSMLQIKELDGDSGLVGIDRRGNIKCMSNEGISESLSVKLYIFNGFLELLQTLMRIDNIVGVSKEK
ncbi:hypothetical protein FSP39_008571 [Pinctada imbricata]|uniref:Bardet-Biedl syndrome 10 protein n=1 Tax=Pinctada imbricata TaxID=66713 RepID=A0AA88XI45_PINIB|nr:hypothetical protein FSP39_008571 [Pinctada imbricata]